MQIKNTICTIFTILSKNEAGTYYLNDTHGENEAGTYYLNDAHGDIVQLTNSSGSVTKDYSYDAFGVENDKNNADTNPWRYCGEYYDTETGNTYLRARYYNADTGRFMTEDPAFDGVNWYSYCGGNPVMYWDPSGQVAVNINIPWLYPDETTVTNILKSKQEITEENYNYNSQFNINGYVNGQGVGDIAKMKFSKSTMAYSGCEIIATYNALISLGDKREMKDLIRSYEEQGRLADGRLGIHPQSVNKYFEEQGYTPDYCTDVTQFDSKLASADVSICVFWNSETNPFDKVHSVMIEKSMVKGKQIGIKVYNEYNEKTSVSYYKSIKEMLEVNKERPIALITVDKKKEEEEK